MQPGPGGFKGFMKYIIFTPVVITYIVIAVPIIVVASIIDKSIDIYESRKWQNTKTKYT